MMLKLLNFTGLVLAISVSALSFPAYARNDNGADSVITAAPVKYVRSSKSEDVRNMFRFAADMTKDVSGKETDIYVKWRISTEASNKTLFLVPSLYVIANGSKNYIEEYYSSIKFNHNAPNEETLRAYSGTVPHSRKTFPTMGMFFTPDIYSQTLFNECVLSPFNKSNRGYYRYQASPVSDSLVCVSFVPRINNTQLVTGSALTEKASGKILSADFAGEFDMLTFSIKMEMNKKDPAIPDNCELLVLFKFTGNNLRSEITSVFLPPKPFAEKEAKPSPIDSLRPMALTNEERAVYAKSDSLKAEKSRASKNIQKKLYTVAWNTIGDNLVNNFKTEMGPNNEFSLRTSPLLNPAYLSYSHRKGVSYRFDLNGRYLISDNSDYRFRIKLGYMFNQRQFFFDAPFTYTYNAAKNGTLTLTVGNGNRITNSSVREQLLRMSPDSISFKNLKLDYYTDMYLKLNTSYNLSDRVSANISLVYHRRLPVSKEAFALAGQPTSFTTFSPMLELKCRPFKNIGPIFSFDYERGMKKIMGSGIEYEKLELDADWLVNLGNLRSLSMRLGGGMYTDRSEDVYFLDFTNFRENNLPGGWNDDWSGDFQLLNPAWYNISDYYVRSNLTYEQPMLLSSLFPYFGKFIEKERIYVNVLWVEQIHPYMEYGYGFTNRYFSTGVYASTRNGRFQSVGCRFTVEIFSRWR